MRNACAHLVYSSEIIQGNRCDIIEEILEENGKGATDTIIKGDWNIVVGEKSYGNIVG
jgi:hypothetical protein